MDTIKQQPKTSKRVCSICKQPFPATTDYFYLVNPKANNGRLRAACKKCYQAGKAKKRQKKPPVASQPKLVVVNKTHGTCVLYEPVQHVPKTKHPALIARFYQYRGYIVIEETDAQP